jgi:hypothetical protein
MGWRTVRRERAIHPSMIARETPAKGEVATVPKHGQRLTSLLRSANQQGKNLLKTTIGRAILKSMVGCRFLS